MITLCQFVSYLFMGSSIAKAFNTRTKSSTLNKFPINWNNTIMISDYPTKDALENKQTKYTPVIHSGDSSR